MLRFLLVVWGGMSVSLFATACVDQVFRPRRARLFWGQLLTAFTWPALLLTRKGHELILRYWWR